MPILKQGHPGCCAAGIYYDFGNAHSRETYHSLEDFAYAMINAGSPSSFNLGWLNGGQTAEIEFLKQLGWKVIYECPSAERRMLGPDMTLMMATYQDFENALKPYRLKLQEVQLKKVEEEKKRRTELQREWAKRFVAANAVVTDPSKLTLNYFNNIVAPCYELEWAEIAKTLWGIDISPNITRKTYYYNETFWREVVRVLKAEQKAKEVVEKVVKVTE